MGFLTKFFAGPASLALPLLAGGCALPPAVTVASFAADGISYVMSGRTVSDHALSYAAQEDCVVFRAVKGESICHSEQTEMALANTTTATTQQPDGAEPIVGISVAQGGTAPVIATEKTPAVPATPDVWASWAYHGDAGKTSTFLALGSYRFRTNALGVATQYAAHSPHIVTAYLDGERFYRVIVGPYSKAEAFAAAKTALIRDGASPWLVRLCGVAGVGSNCSKAG